MLSALTKEKIANKLKGRRHSSERIENIKKSLVGTQTRERHLKTSTTRGMKEFQAILVETGAVVWQGLLKSECATALGINRYKIRDVLYGNRKTYKGYTFSYIDVAATHPDKVEHERIARNNRAVKRANTDLNFRLRRNLRSRLNKAIGNNAKVGSAVSDLGCSIDTLKEHLESRWQEGMNWDNHSHTGWHIDHIMPLASFDLTDPEQLKKACHYTNLQPLWAKDNIFKGDSL